MESIENKDSIDRIQVNGNLVNGNLVNGNIKECNVKECNVKECEKYKIEDMRKLYRHIILLSFHYYKIGVEFRDCTVVDIFKEEFMNDFTLQKRLSSMDTLYLKELYEQISGVIRKVSRKQVTERKRKRESGKESGKEKSCRKVLKNPRKKARVSKLLDNI